MLAGGASEEEILRSVDDYEHAFHKFVDAHERYLRFEDDEGMVAVAKESYEKEIERKFLLDVDISKWKSNMKYESRHSRRSSKMGKDSCSTRSSIKEKRRIVEEVRLRMEALEEKQSLERRLEEEEVEFKRRELELEEERKRSKAELARKMEKMTPEIELKKAAVELKMEQEELQSEYSDDKSGVDEANPALAFMASPDVPRPPVKLTI